MFTLTEEEGLKPEIPVPPPVVTGKPRITCPICGVSILKKGKKRHEKSKRHQETKQVWQEKELNKFKTY